MIKKLSIISLFGMLSFSALQAQTTVYAYLKDEAGKPVESAGVDMKDSQNDVTADKIGYFQFVDLKPGHYSITISKLGFEDKVIEFDVVSDEKRKDLGAIVLSPVSDHSDLGVITIDDTSNQDDDNNSQPTVGLLSSGRDAFANAAAFELGAYWFRPRGVDNRFEDVLFNGVPMSKNDDGKVDFSNWGGLNDVTRYPLENVDNITPSEYIFGNLGGVTYYNTRASSYRKGVSLAYSYTNRSYFNRAMATYNTGLLKNGWAFSFSGSRRWADEGVIEGTYQDAYAYFASIEKRLGSKHALNFTAFGAPTYRGSNSPNTQEAYDIMGKNYNSYWGWQDGEKRNSRIRNVFEPVFQLEHFWKIGKKSNLNTTFSYQQGSDARSRLDWFHAADPNPTYYRKLPSYGIYTAEEFKANSQIDWTGMYQANNGNLDGGAVYSVIEDVNKDKTYNIVSHFDTRFQDNWKFNANFNYQRVESDNFRRVKDLLGAKYAKNLDAYSDDGANFWNLDNTDYKVYEGDRTQYSYMLYRDSYALNLSTEVDLPRWNVVASIFSSYSESYRDGQFRNHFFATGNGSKGKSDVFDAVDAGLKAKVTYKINGKNFLVYNGAYFSLAPTLNEIFVNPRTTNLITPNVENQLINSNDLSYIIRGQVLKLRLTGYYTTIQKATEFSRYYFDISGSTTDEGNALAAEILTNLNKTYKGLELGAEIKVTPTLSVTAVGSYGDYKVTNNPDVATYDDQNGYRGKDFWGTAKIKDYKIAGTPQKAASLGIRYNSPKYWWIGVSGNFLADQYLDFSALNKTAVLYTDPSTHDDYAGVTPEIIDQITAQKKFDDQFMLNANVGKSFLFGKYRMGVSVSVTNILNNRNYVTGGFEQGRVVNFPEALQELGRTTPYFGPKLWYDRGTQFFANVYLRF
jgi:hypothetical protein